MNTFHVHVLLAIIDDINELSAWSANEPTYVNDTLTDIAVSTALKLMTDVDRLCLDHGFNALSREIERNKFSVNSGCTYAELSRIADNLKTRIRDEYEYLLLLWVRDKDFYQQDSLFGEKVAERFKGAATDVKEAGTCYALGRYTACVYHLMRVLEFGLLSIGRRIGFPDERPMWEPVLGFINAELRRNRDVMSDLFKGDIEFLSGIASHMHAVNLAWRRRVAHVERTYTQEEAKRILDSTRNLMQHVAAKLSEIG